MNDQGLYGHSLSFTEEMEWWHAFYLMVVSWHYIIIFFLCVSYFPFFIFISSFSIILCVSFIFLLLYYSRKVHNSLSFSFLFLAHVSHVMSFSIPPVNDRGLQIIISSADFSSLGHPFPDGHSSLSAWRSSLIQFYHLSAGNPLAWVGIWVWRWADIQRPDGKTLSTFPSHNLPVLHLLTYLRDQHSYYLSTNS